MDLPMHNTGVDQQRYRQQSRVLHTSQLSHSSSEMDVTVVEPVSTDEKLDENTLNEEPTPLETTTLPDVVLQNKRKQHATSLCLTLLEILLLGFSVWFIYTEFISEKPVPSHLQLPPGHTITIVNILSHINVFLVVLLLDQAFETLRWSLASRKKGVSMATFLAASKSSSFAGVADLLRVPGWHRLICVQRLMSKGLCLFLGIVLLIDPNYRTVFTPDGTSEVNIVAGLTPLNAYSKVPPSMIDVYFQMYAKDILMDTTLVKVIAPITCSGPNCTSIFLPGGLDLVRIATGGSNATIFEEPATDGRSTFIVNHAPGYHLEFFPIPVGFVFDQATECVTYGGINKEAIYICVAARGTQMYAGWSVCPSSLFNNGTCLNNTSWTDQLDQSTVLNIAKRYATVAYDTANFSILSIESIGSPETTTETFIGESVANLTQVYSLAFTSIPNTFNTSDPNFDTYAASWSNYYMLSWALRLYQDDYRNYPGGPLDVLKSFLTIPIQFSTTAWQWASWDTLPPDLYTTGTYATSASRVLGKPWVLIVFAAGAGSLMLFSALALVWVVVFGPVTPNSSRWPELDTLAKCSIQAAQNSSDEDGSLVKVPDLVMFSRQNGLGNGTSRNVRACLEGRRVFVGAVNGAIVLAVTGNGLEPLEAGQRYH